MSKLAACVLLLLLKEHSDVIGLLCIDAARNISVLLCRFVLTVRVSQFARAHFFSFLICACVRTTKRRLSGSMPGKLAQMARGARPLTKYRINAQSCAQNVYLISQFTENLHLLGWSVLAPLQVLIFFYMFAADLSLTCSLTAGVCVRDCYTI